MNSPLAVWTLSLSLWLRPEVSIKGAACRRGVLRCLGREDIVGRCITVKNCGLFFIDIDHRSSIWAFKFYKSVTTIVCVNVITLIDIILL